jgi:hypothetical protein
MTTATQPIEIPGVTQRQVGFWIKKGYLLPDTPPPGSGHVREWPESEIQVAQLMARLVAAGFAPGAAVKHARAALRQQSFGWPVRLTLPRGVVLEIGEET